VTSGSSAEARCGIRCVLSNIGGKVAELCAIAPPTVWRYSRGSTDAKVERRGNQRPDNEVESKGMNSYIKAALIVSLAITIGFASRTLCGAQTSTNLTDRHTPQRLLAQASEGTSPMMAEAAPSSPCHVSREYVRLINSGQYDKIGRLFSDDAVYMGPDGRTRHGAEDIGAFYKSMLSLLRPKVTSLSFLQNGNQCIMELGEVNSSGDNVKIWPIGSVPHPAAIDIFTINSRGKASKFLVYLRPGTRTQSELRAALAKMH
jgi:SnoaL-like domain